jgi:hypothetical protein
MKKNKLTIDTFKIAEFSNKTSIVGGTGVGNGDNTNTGTKTSVDNCKFTSNVVITSL